MEFTLRYSGAIPSYNQQNVHALRSGFQIQLADLWSRDLRLKDVQPASIAPFVASERFGRDVRQQEKGETIASTGKGLYRYHEVRGIKFVPLVTEWRYLRCDLSVRIHWYEGDLHTGGIFYHRGDLDNKTKVLIDALRMPSHEGELPDDASHSGHVFYCLLEDDRLVTKILVETRNLLGPRPTTAEMRTFDVDVDVRVFPVHALGNVNYTMLFP